MVKDLTQPKKYFKNRYERLKSEQGIEINGKFLKYRKDNINLALDFLNSREDYLTRKHIREPTEEYRYYSTLNKELTYLQNVLFWFNKWDLNTIGEQEIRKVYDQLETGLLKSISDKVLSSNTKKDYYCKMLRNGFFKHIGKDKLAQEIIIRNNHESGEVRFFEYSDFKRMVNIAKFNDHKLLMWLLFDTGTEIKAAIQLKKSDFTTSKDETGFYYIMHVRPEISKLHRSRRDLAIYHTETNELLKSHLSTLESSDYLFNFDYKNCYKFIKKASILAKAKTKQGDSITVKDFRSSCATYYLSIGWSSDEIKARLGHKPSSTVIDRYVSYLGINQKRRIKESKELDLKNYKEQFKRQQETINMQNERIQDLNKDLKLLREFLLNDPIIKERIEKEL